MFSNFRFHKPFLKMISRQVVSLCQRHLPIRQYKKARSFSWSWFHAKWCRAMPETPTQIKHFLRLGRAPMLVLSLVFLPEREEFWSMFPGFYQFVCIQDNLELGTSVKVVWQISPFGFICSFVSSRSCSTAAAEVFLDLISCPPLSVVDPTAEAAWTRELYIQHEQPLGLHSLF